MNREEAINQLNDIKSELKEHLVKKDIVALDMAISALSAEGEYIKKEEFKSAIHNYFIGLNHNVTEEDIQAYIDALALYSFPDREKGEWIATENEEMEVDGYFCSKCDSPMPTDEKTSFCPFCGADMRRDKADE